MTEQPDTAEFRADWQTPPDLHGNCDGLWSWAQDLANALDAARAEIQRRSDYAAREEAEVILLVKQHAITKAECLAQRDSCWAAEDRAVATEARIAAALEIEPVMGKNLTPRDEFAWGYNTALGDFHRALTGDTG